MKGAYLIIGIIIGAVLTFAGIKLTQEKNTEKTDTPAAITTKDTWDWSDELDALKAAPDNHKVVYEDDNLRILAVLLDGQKSEPIHTHKWKSIMWIAKPIVPCQINNYKKNEKGELVISDSIIIKEMPVNIGQMIDPEGPTSIKNLGTDNGVAYRVEFKKEFKK